MSAEPVIRNISDTARWVAALRAIESERPDAMFCDPFARRLAGEKGFEIARTVRHPAVRIAVALRTAAIDRLILEAVGGLGCDAVLSLAAGLDARPWRLELPPELLWVDVDLPEILAYKADVLAADTPRCRHEQVSLDLADRAARERLFAGVSARAKRVAVLTEGLLSYLEPDAVGELADDLREHAEFAEWISDVTGGKVAQGVRGAGDKHSPDDVRSRFAPLEGTAFFEPHGWKEAAYIDLFLDSRELGRETALGAVLRWLVAVFPSLEKKLERGAGVVRMEPSPTAPA